MQKYNPIARFERAQSLVRLAVVTLFSGLVLLTGANETKSSTLNLLVIGISFLFSLIMLVHIFNRPEAIKWRVPIAIIVDPILTASGFYIAGEYALPLIFIFFSTPVVHGLRFGLNHLAVSALLNLVGLIVSLTIFSPNYEHSVFLLGVIITYPVIMLLTGFIIKKLADIKLKLTILSMQDPLTGLPNRRMFIEHLQRVMAGAKRSKLRVACLLIDIDGFKNVNDKHGYLIGDNLLKRVADVLRNQIRDTDYVARLSGDEFVFCAECTASHLDISVLAERIINAISSIKSVGDFDVDITASIGIAYYRHVETVETPIPDKLIHLADKAMYNAKHLGKNQVFIFPKELPFPPGEINIEE